MAPFCARRAGRRCSTRTTRVRAAAATTEPLRARPASPSRRQERPRARAATTSPAASSRVRRVMDWEPETTHRATPASSPATSPARMRRTSSLRPSARRACPARRVTRCRVPRSSEAFTAMEPWTSRSTPPWSRARRATTPPPARARCPATTRVVRSRGSRGRHRRRPSGVATVTVRLHPATTPGPATTVTRRPMPRALPSPADRFT